MPHKDPVVRREYFRAHYEKRRDVVRHAKEKPCIDCGIEYPYYVMQFDHVRGEKVGDLGKLAQKRSIPKLLEEIAKCDVVCANCHAVRTFERQSMVCVA